MSDAIVIDAEVLPATLPDALQGIARRYLDARRRANEETLAAAAALAEARAVAEHGEWYAFLKTTNTPEDLADRLLAIHAEAQRDPRFREQVARGWLPQTQAALVARPSTPPAAREHILQQAEEAAAQQSPPPSKRQIEQTIRAHRPASAHPAPVRDSVSPPAPASPPAALPPALTIGGAPTTLPPPLFTSPAPAGAAEVIAVAPPIAPGLPPPLALRPMSRSTTPDLASLKTAEALLALLEQALALAESERDRLRGESGTAPVITISDAVVEQAARTFLAVPATRSAAALLAMSASVEDA